MKRVLVTGSTGFVGKQLCPTLSARGFLVRAALRTNAPAPAGATETVVTGDIHGTTDWSRALEGVDVVVHAAARAHVMHDSSQNDELYFETNARSTLGLAKAAAHAGVRRMVFVSSIKVNGERTLRGRPFTGADTPQPKDVYGESKRLGEQYLREVSDATSLEGVVVRPPLVYGPGVKGNFLRLLRLVHARRPLPLGMIDNSRSLVSVWNLCDYIATLAEHAAAPGRAWLVSDGENLATPELIRRIGEAMKRPARLLPVPPQVLGWVGAMIGRRDEVARLCESLEVDTSPARVDLGWSAPLSVRESLSRTVSWYLTQGASG